MEQAVVRPSKLAGHIVPPPSKSEAHRALICAALAKGASRISPAAGSEDIAATAGALRALGARVREDAAGFTVDGEKTRSRIGGEIDCRESGSTLRFLIPVAAAGPAAGGAVTFTGAGRLPQRPIGPYLDCLPARGVSCASKGGLPLTIRGRLQPGEFALPGDVSSQFVTGLLLALPLLGGDSSIRLLSPLESAGYVALTRQVQQRFGVESTEEKWGYSVKGRQNYTPCDYKVEGDWSQAAFWLCADALGAQVAVEGLTGSSPQGDRAILAVLERFGCRVISQAGGFSVRPVRLAGATVDASQIPDLVPAIAAVAALSEGETRIVNAARLRIKESDRLHAVAAGLSALGAKIREEPDGLAITGAARLRGGEADSFGDHRIAMALAVAALGCDGPVVIRGSDSVRKSYPGFFKDYQQLGGNVDVIHVG